MSYSGTVHCRNCYGTGHNRRTCPQLTEQYKQRAEREVEQGEDRGHWHTQYAKRTGVYLDGTKATELKRSRRGGTRRCKYCAKTGHNTRTCAELKEHKTAALVDTKAIRAKIVTALQEQGLGIGALVTKTEYGEKIGYMVTGFNLEQVNSESINHNPNVIQITALNPSQVQSYNRVTGIPLPPIEGVNDGTWNTNTELVGPVSGSAAVVTIPDGWVEDGSFLEALFEDRQSPNWSDNRYDY